SQNFITRELVALDQAGIRLHVAARSVTVRADLSANERSLLDRFVRLPENPFWPRYLWSHLLCFLQHPLPYFRALRHLVFSGHDRISRWMRAFVCFARAASVARDVRALRVDLIHGHFLTAPTETALYLGLLCERPYGATAHAMDIYLDKSGNRKKLEAAK